MITTLLLINFVMLIYNILASNAILEITKNLGIILQRLNDRDRKP
jgi:hypothetical protein